MMVFIVVGLIFFMILSGGCSPATGEWRAPFTATPGLISTNTNTPSLAQEKTATPFLQTKLHPTETITPSQVVPPTGDLSPR
jgi:hypothetical protein